ncbi:MAG: hypothetical protein AMJ90_03285 [candidate division Zixibacteria bacterium SM23_73_2]|nr:MAG: hypothetical protein AMJ90_03285 [candidate division Zixibacteria bacterium SM23_73_2]
MRRIIAIDGPAGSGKSTTARLVAERLRFLYLDTGAMYRAITLKALEEGIDLKNEEELEELALDSKIEFRKQNSNTQVFIDGEDVTSKIRDPLIDRNVSLASKHRKLREVLVGWQRQMGEKNDLVAEGRDTTTVVFPDALVKVYLDCDLKERAKRRLLEFKQKGIPSTLKEQSRELSTRDKFDSGRKVSPLLQDRDAVVVDTTDLTIEQQVQKVIEVYQKILKAYEKAL